LAAQQLCDRDLALTLDFRDVLGELGAKHLGNGRLAGLFLNTRNQNSADESEPEPALYADCG
jgi:hypothetical protein